MDFTTLIITLIAGTIIAVYVSRDDEEKKKVRVKVKSRRTYL